MDTSEWFDPFEILGVELDASDQDIKKAYRRLAQKYHPDRNKSPTAEERFKEIGAAYDELKDPARRAQWRSLMERYAEAREDMARQAREERQRQEEQARKAQEESEADARRAQQEREWAERRERRLRERIERRGREAREAAERRAQKQKRNERRRRVRERIERRRRQRETAEAERIGRGGLEALLRRYRGLVDGNGVDAEAVRLDGNGEPLRSQTYHFGIHVAWKFGFKSRIHRTLPGDQSKGTQVCETAEELTWAQEDRIADLGSHAEHCVAFARRLDVDDEAAWRSARAGRELEFHDFPTLSYTYECLVCEGKPRVRCRACHGEGKVVCPECKGENRRHCFQCSGTRRVPCKRCEGEGATLCRKCQGKHYVTQKADLVATANAQITFLWDDCEDDSLAAQFRDWIRRDRIPLEALRSACRLERLGRDEVVSGIATMGIYYGGTAHLQEGRFVLDLPGKGGHESFTAIALGEPTVDLTMPRFLDKLMAPVVEQLDRVSGRFLRKKQAVRSLLNSLSSYPLLAPALTGMTLCDSLRPAREYAKQLYTSGQGYLSDAMTVTLITRMSPLLGLRMRGPRRLSSMSPTKFTGGR